MRARNVIIVAFAAALLGLAALSLGQGFGEGGREGLWKRLKDDLGMLGWRGRRDASIKDPRAAAKDLEERRIYQEKEQRIGEARRKGGEATFDEFNRELFGSNLERVAARRLADWGGRANPGSNR